MRPPGELRHPQRLFPNGWAHALPRGHGCAHALGPDGPPVSLPDSSHESLASPKSHSPSVRARWTVLGPRSLPRAPSPFPHAPRPDAASSGQGRGGGRPAWSPLPSRARVHTRPTTLCALSRGCVSGAQGSVEKCLDVQMKSFREKRVSRLNVISSHFKRIKIIKILLEVVLTKVLQERPPFAFRPEEGKGGTCCWGLGAHLPPEMPPNRGHCCPEAPLPGLSAQPCLPRCPLFLWRLQLDTQTLASA